MPGAKLPLTSAASSTQRLCRDVHERQPQLGHERKQVDAQPGQGSPHGGSSSGSTSDRPRGWAATRCARGSAGAWGRVGRSLIAGCGL